MACWPTEYGQVFALVSDVGDVVTSGTPAAGSSSGGAGAASSRMTTTEGSDETGRGRGMGLLGRLGRRG